VIYLDYNATTPVHPAVRQAILLHLEGEYGNPSSSHSKGQAAKAAVDSARAWVAKAIGAAAGAEVFFTGSATEANNLAILGTAGTVTADRRHLIVSAVEHPAVMEPALALRRQGWRLSVAPVERDGRIDLDALAALLGAHPTALVSVMHANNELGTLQPVEAVGRLAHEHGALFHVDAAQSMGKVPVDVNTIGADLLTIAGHKMYAPKGIGALYVRRGTAIEPLQFGASQEGGLRPGTENVAYIAGLGAAARLVMEEGPGKRLSMAALRGELQERLQAAISGLTVNGSLVHRLPNTLHVSLPQGSARVVVELLADQVAISPGAACHSGADYAPSGVMRAIGATAQQAQGALRISLGYDTTPADVERAARLISAAYQRQALALGGVAS
jgi:cysteine desulfurase